VKGAGRVQDDIAPRDPAPIDVPNTEGTENDLEPAGVHEPVGHRVVED
jgi:hypothetical protein